MEWPLRLRTLYWKYFTVQLDLAGPMTSSTASPTSHNLTSMPAVFIPVLVASFTASNNLSYLGSNARSRRSQ